jgi:hypothetical protein
MKTARPFTLFVASLLAACVSAPVKPPPPAPPTGLSELLERPAERALVEGIRAYDDGLYVQSEAALKRALAGNLVSPRDLATAHKLMAFITCTSNRMAECEAAFAAARVADPGFTLSRSEAGHPLWGPVWKKVASAPQKAASAP